MNNSGVEEFNNSEGKEILKETFNKTMHTLEILLTQLNMMFYWEKLRLSFNGKNPSLEQLYKLMNRCLKLYQMIDGFMKIFKMIQYKEKYESKKEGLVNADIDDKLQQLEERIYIAVKLLLKENPVLPISFRFKGECLLEKYKRDNASSI